MVTQSALESMQTAHQQTQQAQQPAQEQPAQQPVQDAPFDASIFLAAANEIDNGDLQKQKELTKQLLLGRLPPEKRQAAAHLLEMQEAAQMLRTKEEDLNRREYQNQVLAVANKYRDVGVTPDLLWGMQADKMEAWASRLKDAKGGTDSGENATVETPPTSTVPNAMRQRPSVGASGQVGTAKTIEAYRGQGLKNLASYIEDIFIG